RKLVLRDHLVERVRHLVVREELLELRVELEALYAVMLDQPARLARRVLAARIDARERNHHVRMLGRELRDLLVRYRLHAARALAVDREHDARHAPLAVVRGDFRNGRTRRVVLEDRKSTRLNSSHVKISYAVFCLKKKSTK